MADEPKSDAPTPPAEEPTAEHELPAELWWKEFLRAKTSSTGAAAPSAPPKEAKLISLARLFSRSSNMR